MARPLWKGNISFSLINIPVMVMSAKEEHGIHFSLLDERGHGPIGYRQYNKVTGKDVPRDRIVKGYEYDPGHFVIVTDTDLKNANVKATQTIDIEDFVQLKDIDLLYFERPYYLIPDKNGEKGYMLLVEALRDSGRAAIAKIVLHNRQRLVAVFPREERLILEILRYAHEIRQLENTEFPIMKSKVPPREVEMAAKIVESMSAEWRPEKYHDTYYDDLMKWIESKAKHGKLAHVPIAEKTGASQNANVVDLMPLLQESLKAASAKTRRRA